jgi:2-hydroxychromene-2-carboxylate isomerase
VFDLGCAWTYLAAERVEQLFSSVRWTPVLLPGADIVAPPVVRLRRAAVEARAAALRMPLIWPETASSSRRAMRVASFAAEHDRAGAFVLAAGRLAYCGGFDLDDPEILAEAAAAACLPLTACFGAARDHERDGAMLAAGRALLAAGVDRLPAVRVRGMVFSGEERLCEAVAATRAPVLATQLS